MSGLGKMAYRGRDLFTKTEPWITLAQASIQVLPWQVASFFFEISRNTPGLLGFGLRYIFLRRLANSCGRAVSVYPGSYFLNIRKLGIGDFVSLHQMCYLECAGGLKIGDNVAIAHSVSIITLEHDYRQTNLPMRDAPVILRPVTIENNVWIGAGARILAGVTVGENAVIGAGAVVTRFVPAGAVFAGVPAREIGRRNEVLHKSISIESCLDQSCPCNYH